MKLRSLFVAVASAFLLTSAFVPRADAFVVSYFNLEGGGPLVFPAEKTPAAGGDNDGGGIESSTSPLTFGGTNTGNAGLVAGLPFNVTPGDEDANLRAINFNSNKNTTTTATFSVNLQFYAGLSLSYALNNNGNGYQTVNLNWTGAPAPPGGITMENPQTSGTTIVFDLTSFTALNGDGMTAKVVTFTLTFTNAQSNGQNLQTVIDNVRLDTTTIVPEPATVASGLLGVLGLCWHQRRRLIRFTRFRRA